MKFSSSLLVLLAAVGTVTAYNATGPITYLGDKGKTFSSGTLAHGIVWTAGLTGTINGTIVPGGFKPQTVQAINNVAAVLKEAGTSWANVLKTTVYLNNIADFDALNEIYMTMVPFPRPARATIQAGKLASKYEVEIEVVAVVPQY